MPELPEVVTIKRDLEKHILGKKIIGVEIARSAVVKGLSPAQFKKKVIGQRVKKIIRQGKLLIFELQKDKFLIIHLRITGWLKYGLAEKKARVIFKFSGKKFLNYMDPRLLGHILLRKEYKDLDFIKRLGPEIFSLKPEDFKEKVKERKGNIKALIMNQNFLAGLGNIYAQEALFLAGIDPRRSASSLSEQEINLLYQKIKAVLKEAIKHRGSSVDDYRDTEGKKGGMEKRLKVYMRDKQACCRCQGRIKKVKVAGRGTCFCPSCQH